MSNKIKDNSKNNNPEPEQTSFWKELLSWIEVVAIAAAIAFVVNNFLIANSRVPTSSMEPTIMTGDRVFGSRLTYKFSDIERGDIVIFRYPLDEKTYFVKRVIGLPGDVVDVKDGHVYLNNSDTPMDEPYIAEPMNVEPPLHFEVPEGHYFCMGDNRNNSMDARYWDMIAKQYPDSFDPNRNYSYVAKNKIIAKVYFRYWPKPSKLE